MALRTSRSLFAQICVVMQRREIDLKKVFKYPLGPFPWSLAGQNGERVRRSSGTVAINTYKSSISVASVHVIFSIKTLLIQFVVDQWSKNPYFLTVERQVIYATVGDTCFEISRYGKTEVESLQCHQEEADTRMFFHLVHGVRVSQRFVIHTPDTDVFNLTVAVSGQKRKSIYIKTGYNFFF